MSDSKKHNRTLIICAIVAAIGVIGGAAIGAFLTAHFNEQLQNDITFEYQLEEAFAKGHAQGLLDATNEMDSILEHQLEEAFSRGYAQGLLDEVNDTDFIPYAGSNGGVDEDSHNQNNDPVATYTPMHQFTNITSRIGLTYSSASFRDNWGNSHNGGYVVGSFEGRSYRILLNGTYSRFSAIFFVLEGETQVGNARLFITFDGVEAYTVSLTKACEPVPIDIEIPHNVRDFELRIPGYGAISFAGWPPATAISNAVFH
ncbi:MAG: hypothetical protein FWE06_05600 [Oscillospiraceae bacterium]|nr:hypothetical protein [Oscillospiraceae bacterium]